MRPLIATALLALLGIACSGSSKPRAAQDPGRDKPPAPAPAPSAVDYEAAFLKLEVPDPPPLPAVP
jgi:hypothetical protein